jgi:lipopolysaccharide/colanic/teichoic acid biosynthesis glycosyltransferase
MTTAATPPVQTAATATPTIWGCTPSQAHDRFWAAFGVQVVRRNERSEIIEGAEMFLLCEPGTLVLFRIAHVLDTFFWLHPKLMLLRVKDARPRTYYEVAVTKEDRIERFQRVYRDARARSVRVAITSDPALAREWQNTPSEGSAWRRLRSRVAREDCIVRPAAARVYDGRDDAQLMECVRDMTRYWKRPDTTVRRVHRPSGEVWADSSARIADAARFVGPVWVGAGRRIDAGAHIVGPAILWDDPATRPPADEVRWLEIEPSELAPPVVRRVTPRTVPGKRAFDIVFSLAALALTLPLYPLVALAIMLEDGRPIFFAHRRETVGGREFPCLKFRSMRKAAEQDKAKLGRANQADGPQFFIKDDPRTTVVGRFLRKCQIDELPQFINVLLGHMSVVGPRPSPYSENQFCPPWREARLSVRPGVTGLWQVSRTRKSGLDFQEWIRFDLEYVESASWALDLKIIARTLRHVVPFGRE